MITVRSLTSYADMEACHPPRCAKVGGRFGFNPAKAYVYLVIATHGRAKVGVSANPMGRVKEIINFYRKAKEILIVGPLESWKATERRLTDAFKAHVVKGMDCMATSREWFKLPRRELNALRACFLSGCTDAAVDKLQPKDRETAAAK